MKKQEILVIISVSLFIIASFACLATVSAVDYVVIDSNPTTTGMLYNMVCDSVYSYSSSSDKFMQGQTIYISADNTHIHSIILTLKIGGTRANTWISCQIWNNTGYTAAPSLANAMGTPLYRCTTDIDYSTLSTDGSQVSFYFDDVEVDKGYYAFAVFIRNSSVNTDVTNSLKVWSHDATGTDVPGSFWNINYNAATKQVSVPTAVDLWYFINGYVGPTPTPTPTPTAAPHSITLKAYTNGYVSGTGGGINWNCSNGQSGYTVTNAAVNGWQIPVGSQLTVTPVANASYHYTFGALMTQYTYFTANPYTFTVTGTDTVAINFESDGATPFPTATWGATPTPEPNIFDNGTATPYIQMLVPVIILAVAALLGWKFAGAWGFFLGINIGAILTYAILGSTVFPLWGIVVLLIVDGLLLFGKVGFRS